MSTFACGSCGVGGVAGAAGADSPGMAGRPGMDDVAGAAGAAGAGCVRPGIGAALQALREPPGLTGAEGVAACASPGIEGTVAAEVAGDVAAADGTPGKVMPGAAGAAGGVAPRAVARFCRIWGALAAELISCCGMFGMGRSRHGVGVGDTARQ